MFEIIMMIAAISAMAKIADAEDRSAILWGALTFVICVVSIGLMPGLFLLNITIGFFVTLGLMIVAKIMGGR